MSYETIIGLEVHVQLNTKSKIFSGAATTFGAEPNTQACAIDLGLPGVLPVLNKEAVKLAVTVGLAIDAKINNRSIFARKNYFYPDLPKGYQISQHELPIVGEGKLAITLDYGTTKIIRITRAHLEEDAGKSLHEGLPNISGIDLNRAGTPLLEIVSEPDMRSAKEAVAYLKTLHSLVRYIGISDGNMQEGSFRCDVNISLRPKGSNKFGTRAEIKNLNSFRFIERAILHETKRQADILENGGKITQETRLYDPEMDETRTMRSKEEAHDYRYFPDPDLLPLKIDDEYIRSIKEELPELPWEKLKRFKEQYHLNNYDAKLMTADLDAANYFETVLKIQPTLPAKLVANWIGGDIAMLLNKENKNITECPVTPTQLAGLLNRIHDNTISTSIAKKVFETLWNGEGSDADGIIEQQGLKQITDTSFLEKVVNEVINSNPEQVAQFHAGKDKLIAFFVGKVMAATKGKAHHSQVNELLLKKLK